MDWISVKERLPDKSDSDFGECVLAWHAFQGVMLIGYQRISESRYITHWRKTPEPPLDYKEIQEEMRKR